MNDENNSTRELIDPERIGPYARTTEWYNVRRDKENPRFGASDAAALLGQSKYNTPLGLYTEFMDKERPRSDDDWLAMRRGSIYESAIQQDWSSTYAQSLVVSIPMIFHGEPFAPGA